MAISELLKPFSIFVSLCVYHFRTEATETATIDLIEVVDLFIPAAIHNALVGISRDCRRSGLPGSDIGDEWKTKIDIRAPPSAAQHFQLFAIGLRKLSSPLADPDVCDQEAVRDASNEFVHAGLSCKPWRAAKISPSTIRRSSRPTRHPLFRAR